MWTKESAKNKTPFVVYSLTVAQICLKYCDGLKGALQIEFHSFLLKRLSDATDARNVAIWSGIYRAKQIVMFYNTSRRPLPIGSSRSLASTLQVQESHDKHMTKYCRPSRNEIKTRDLFPALGLKGPSHVQQRQLTRPKSCRITCRAIPPCSYCACFEPQPWVTTLTLQIVQWNCRRFRWRQIPHPCPPDSNPMCEPLPPTGSCSRGISTDGFQLLVSLMGAVGNIMDLRNCGLEEYCHTWLQAMPTREHSEHTFWLKIWRSLGNCSP